MNILRNLSLKIKILLIILLPLGGYLFFAATNILYNYQQFTSYNDIYELSALSNTISNVVHELQKERGASAGFLGSKGRKFVEKLPIQHKETDKRKRLAEIFLADFDINRFDPELANKIKQANSQIASLDSERQGILNQQRTVKEAVAYYSNTNAKLLDVIGYMTQLSDDARIASSIGAYYNFLQGKERAGKERAVLSGVFSKENFSPSTYASFIQLVTEQNTYFSVFKTLAEPEHVQFVSKTVSGASVDKVEQMRKIARDVNVDTGKTFGIDPEIWFDTITIKINKLKQAEDYLSSAFRSSAEKLTKSQKRTMTFSIISVAIILAVSLFMLFFVTKTILQGVGTATKVALELAEGEGDLSKRMDLRTKDEIGVLGDAVDSMLANLSVMIGGIQGISSSLETGNQALSTVSNKMHNSTDLVSGKASTVATAAEEMSVNMTNVSVAVETASQNVSSVAASTEKISSVSHEISTNTGQANEIAQKAVSLVTSSSDRVNELGTAAHEIGKVTETINEISEKTNLLALNATIEAARAGEAGKGFAVVANEIKDLAKQTAEATVEIRDLIEKIQDSTKGTVDEISDISKVINEVNEIVSSITFSVETQTLTTSEIINNINQASQGISEVSENVSQASIVTNEVARDIADVDQSSNELQESTTNVTDTAGELSSLAQQLKNLVGKFKV